jgi:hypothetical protein
MTSASPASPDNHGHRVGLWVGVTAEVLLLGLLAYAAWGPNENEVYPPLSLSDGLANVAILASVPSVLIACGALSITGTRRWWGPLLASVLIGVAGFIGFIGFALISIGRCETCDDA